jgi:hypothetical protein
MGWIASTVPVVTAPAAGSRAYRGAWNRGGYEGDWATNVDWIRLTRGERPVRATRLER